MAIRDSHIEVALELLKHPKVNVNETAGNLGSPLHIAVVYQFIDIIKKLL